MEFEEGLPPDEAQIRAFERGGRPALVESFGIRGLYGDRTISLTSRHAATILIARNGTGKTTLLGALDAFLKMQLMRLRELEFTEIFCRLRGLPDELILSHDELVAFLQVPKDGEFARLASRTGVDPQKLFEFILDDIDAAFDSWLTDNDYNSVINTIVRAFPDKLSALKSCYDVYRSMFARSSAMTSLRIGLDAVFDDYEIVYLPTYRRIELALADRPADRRLGRARPKLSFAASGLHTGNIQFGLGDIADRLSELNSEIIVNSNRGYRELSENIINELIEGYQVSAEVDIPKPDDLKLFFSRLIQSNRTLGPYYPISAPDLSRIYREDGVPQESRKFLQYFLGKLNEVIKITKTIEQPVGDFIASCNKYLSSTEPSTIVDFESEHRHLQAADGKKLTLDRTDLSVYVESIPARKPITLDALSSGEKQMISLFAKMYLYPKKKIVLIDEPELSLSIDWQRGILVDVLLSPQCEQIIAITHSPFVFDNALEPFTRTVGLGLTQRTEPELDFYEPTGYERRP